jgi:poly(3-hydroxybutyrate) depolymerase
MKITVLLSFLLFFSLSISYAQVEKGSFEFEGKVRDYFVYLPTNFKPNMPVVFNLHPTCIDAQWQMDYTNMNSIADTMGFVVVYPEAITPGFSSGIIAKYAEC